MARRFFDPGVQFVNRSTGAPLAGGLIYTYVTGTSTLATTYTDQGGGTANDNPLTLDPYGMIDNSSKNIWGSDTVTYRVVIKSADAATTYVTIDNVDGIINTGESYLFDDGEGIKDSAGNEQLMFTKTSSAVNYANLTNAATGDPVVLEAAGSDTDIDLQLDAKGTGGILLNDVNLKVTDGYGVADSNGNEELLFGVTSSAVNHTKITNAATGNNPTLSVLGDDSNVGLDVQLKGTGTLNVKGTSTAAAEVRLYEDTDNGSNYVGLKAGSIASNLSLILPVADGTNGQVIQTDGSGNLSFVDQTGSSGGRILQIVQTTYTSTASTTSTSYTDLISVAITPSSTSSKILLLGQIGLASGPNSTGGGRCIIKRGSTSLLVGDTSGSRVSIYGMGTTSAQGQPVGPVPIAYTDSPSTTSEVTYYVSFATSYSGEATYVNRGYTSNNAAVTSNTASLLMAIEVEAVS